MFVIMTIVYSFALTFASCILRHFQKPTHRKFGEDEDEDYDDAVEDNFEENEDEGASDRDENGKEFDGSEDDAPEVVSSSSLDVQRLRELHEKLGSVVGKSKKTKKSKRKNKDSDESNDKNLNVDADVGLDMSVLENLDADINELNQELEEQEMDRDGVDEEMDENNESGNRFKIDATSRRSTKIGNMEVSILKRGDPLDSFKVSERALEFQKSVVDAYGRKEVGGFVKNKKKRPKK